MRSRVLVALLSIAAGVAGFYWRHQALKAREADEAVRVAQARRSLQKSLGQAELDLRDGKFKEARDGAVSVQNQDPHFEPVRVEHVLEVSEKALRELTLIQAGETAVQRGQLQAAELAWKGVPDDTEAREQRLQLRAHLGGLISQRYAAAREAASGSAEAVNKALAGLHEVQGIDGASVTALMLEDALWQRMDELGGKPKKPKPPAEEAVDLLLGGKLDEARQLIDRCSEKDAACRTLRDEMVERAKSSWKGEWHEPDDKPVKTWKDFLARKPYDDPGDATANHIGMMYSELEHREFERARDAAFALLAMDPVQPSAHALLARFPDLGREECEAAERLAPHNPGGAKVLFEEAIRRAPIDSPWAKKAAEGLQKLQVQH